MVPVWFFKVPRPSNFAHLRSKCFLVPGNDQAVSTALEARESRTRLILWERASRVLGLFVLLIASLALAGWAFEVDLLKTAFPGLPPIKLNTALGFAALGLWLGFFRRRGDGVDKSFSVLSAICGVFVAAIGLMTLIEYLSGANFGIDHLFFQGSASASAGAFPDRMAPASALNFLLLGLVILLVQKENARRYSAAQTLATFVGLVSLSATIGYFYGVRGFHLGVLFTPISLPAALGFLFSGAGILLGTAPSGWMTQVASETPGGSMLRRLIPMALILTTVLGWFRLKGEELGFFPTAVGTTLLVISIIVLYSIGFWSNGRLLNRVAARAEQNREWLRVTLASIGDAVIATDAQAKVTYLNPIAETLTGWSLESAQGQPVETVFSLTNERTGEPGVCPVAQVLQDGRAVALSNHTALVSRGGQRTSIEDSAAPIKDGAGEVIGVVMVFRDVTERRRIETERRRANEAVRKSEEEYRILFSSMEEGFCTIEVKFDQNEKPVDYLFLEINPAFERQTGLKDAKGKWMRELAPQHEQHWFDIYGAIALTGESARFENRAEALGRWYEVYAFRVGPPALRRVGIVFNDITERKRREEEMRAAGERFRFLAESMPQKIFTSTPGGEVDYFNRQWLEFTGLAFEQIRGWGWLQFIHPDDVEENVRSWKHSIETGEPFYLEHRFRRSDGTYHWHVTRAHAMRDGHGEVLMWIGSNTDIDEVRQAKEQAERASRTKDEFLAALSHELRTPLTPVLMTAAVLRDDARLPLDARDQLSMMKRNIELEARLIDDLLDLTRIAQGKLMLRMEPCDAHSLIALAVEMVRSEARTKGLAVEIDLRAGRANVMADPARLQQVFWNLLKNAVKFTPESGHLSVRSRDNEGRLTVEIADTGVGIEPDSVDRIFLPFEQAREVQKDRRFGGLGLGLSISKAILDLHGGEINAQSPGPGQGATFRVQLPATDAPVTRRAESLAPAPDFGGKTQGVDVAATPLRVLLVEDHEATIQVIRQLLTRAGHNVTSAMTVAGAIQAAENARFDLVISDLGLPDGTGFDLMQHLRATCNLPGIALSGFGMDEDLRRSHEAGFAAHLIKPVDFARLQQAMRELAPAKLRDGAR